MFTNLLLIDTSDNFQNMKAMVSLSQLCCSSSPSTKYTVQLTLPPSVPPIVFLDQVPVVVPVEGVAQVGKLVQVEFVVRR